MDKFACARATVDQVISDLVGSKTLTSERGSGTYVAGPVKRTAGKSISIVAPYIGSPSSMAQQIVNGFMEGLGNETQVRYFTYEELKHPRSWETCKAQRGVVFIQPDVQHSPLLDEARAQKIPHLLLYRDHPESSFVSVDNQSGVAALVDALVAQGRTRIAYASLRQGRYHFPEQRYAGYLEGLLRNRLAYNKEWAALTPSVGRDAFLKGLFKSGNTPDAVISADMPVGLIIKAAEDRGLIMGKDVMLACFDEVPPNTYAFPVLSLRTITAEIGREGAKTFFKLLQTPELILQQYIEPETIQQ
jgi:DNA-binding LacI/PurR family transcriptional regulator